MKQTVTTGEPGPLSVLMAKMRRDGPSETVRSIRQYGALSAAALFLTLLETRKGALPSWVRTKLRSVVNRGLIEQERALRDRFPDAVWRLPGSVAAGSDPLDSESFGWLAAAVAETNERGSLRIDCSNALTNGRISRLVEAYLALEEIGDLQLDLRPQDDSAAKRATVSTDTSDNLTNIAARSWFETAIAGCSICPPAPAQHNANRFLQCMNPNGIAIAVFAGDAVHRSTEPSPIECADDWIRTLTADIEQANVRVTLYMLDLRAPIGGDGDTVSVGDRSVRVHYPRELGLETHDLLALAQMCDGYIGRPSLFAAATFGAGGFLILLPCTGRQEHAQIEKPSPPHSSSKIVWANAGLGGRISTLVAARET